MTDKELLEYAAKAAEYDWRGTEFNGGTFIADEHGDPKYWNPLKDDGDAFRLAVKLGISITPYPIYQPEKHSVIAKQRRVSDTLREANPTETIELHNDDPYAATRRAIVRAAAEIGRNMK